MSKCTDHCFHKECLENQLKGKENLRCAVCNQIYGVLTGEMPPGQMRWRLYPKNKHEYCEGYKEYGMWEIDYSFPNGRLPNGQRYTGTRRVAFLPDCPQGREVLTLLIKAF
jgi:deltex